jgi:hypothetical protein
LGKFQQPIACRKRIVSAAVLVAQYARDEPDHGVDHHHRGHLAAVDDEVADRHLLGLQNVIHALVEPLVPAA